MFGRKKKQTEEAPSGAPAGTGAGAEAGAEAPETDDPRAEGPFDVSEIESRDGYLDLGAILIKPQDGVGVRLEVDEKSKRPRAVSLDMGGSMAQIQAFAAPRTTGLWEEIRNDLKDSLKRNNGAPEFVEGTFGTELRARFAAKTSDGTNGYRPARFVGIDGPRWFLRTVISGAAAIDPEASAKFDAIIRSVVVVRGSDPMPPRDLLPLNVPEGAQRAPAGKTVRRAALRPQGGAAKAPGHAETAGQKPARPAAPGAGEGAQERTSGERGGLQPPERGPEVTEIR
ncbi:DUF3710 domain-containing protein [Kocuria coralli]|uniref:DUF3710 domain-containing protein n=1 Tax=Kocuria coralli TaxID=1461025 RepID=UPI0015F2D0FC|nr:DUF3710 domain-containing protein [Kocuria coralli]